MKDTVTTASIVTPILFPYEPQEFWQSIRQIIREEVSNVEKQKPAAASF
jgi:hypothetical protein